MTTIAILRRWLCFPHHWTGWRQSPGECAQVNLCLRCGKARRKEDVHHFSAWSDPEDEAWAQYIGMTKVRTFCRTVQRRKCQTCNLRQDRYLND